MVSQVDAGTLSVDEGRANGCICSQAPEDLWEGGSEWEMWFAKKKGEWLKHEGRG